MFLIYLGIRFSFRPTLYIRCGMPRDLERDTLEFFPQIDVRIRCDYCNRAGGWRLTRLVEKYGCAIPLDELLGKLAHDTCTHRPENQRKGKRWSNEEKRCLAYFAIDPPPPPTRPPEGQPPAISVVEADGTFRKPKKAARR